MIKGAKGKPVDKREFAFVDGERTFTCYVAPRRASESELWWWVSVSGGNGSRYAPFQVADEDTPESVQERVVAYYDDHIARRSAPPQPRWGRPPANAKPAS
jgi:hypothetical protein